MRTHRNLIIQPTYGLHRNEAGNGGRYAPPSEVAAARHLVDGAGYLGKLNDASPRRSKVT